VVSQIPVDENQEIDEFYKLSETITPSQGISASHGHQHTVFERTKHLFPVVPQAPDVPALILTPSHSNLKLRRSLTEDADTVGLLKQGHNYKFAYITNGWAKISEDEYERISRGEAFQEYSAEHEGWCPLALNGLSLLDFAENE